MENKETIEEHVKRLEGELARVRRGLRLMLISVLAAAIVCGVSWGIMKVLPKTSRTNALILEDVTNGKTLARLRASQGGPELTLYDKNGEERAELGVCEEGPILLLFDENGKRRVELGISDNIPRLHMYDANDTLRAWLRVGQTMSGLCLMDVNGKMRNLLCESEEGQALVLADENEIPRIELSSSIVPGLYIRDEDGMLRAWLRVGKSYNGITALTLYNMDGNLIEQVGH